MNPIQLSFWQTLRSPRLLWLLYGVTLALALLAALPFYTTLQAETGRSLAFENLLGGFDDTVFGDFWHRSGRAVSPLLRVGRWLGVLYVGLSVFFAGGILWRFSQPNGAFNGGTFWAACSQYVGRYVRLLGVTILFVLVGAGVWLVIGALVEIAVSDTLTERGQFWIGFGFFGLFFLTATLVLCIGDYAKVLMFREDERRAFRAFGRAGRLVLGNVGATFGRYWLLIAIGTGLFGLYFLMDDLITMRNWPTIIIMLVVQQALIFARVALKVWSLGVAYHVYERLPKPVLRSIRVERSVATDAAPTITALPTNETE